MKRIIAALLLVSLVTPSFAEQNDNKPQSVENFMDLGFGMFIHWSMDSQLGVVISHSAAGASKEYRDKYFNELPKTFNPKKFDPEEWAVLAKLAGMEYVVFTAKHHSGFCMYPTKTTDFNIMCTPFKRDVTKEIIDAFRAQGIKIGLYFSPCDFWVLEQMNYPIGRKQLPMHFPMQNERLMTHDKKQLKELLSNYGKIDVLFLDGPAEGLKEYAWSLQPDIMVTRGAITTPEQKMPDAAIPGPWEACYTMGTDWQYKPTNDPHKSGYEIIKMLVEIRAKGGNFLLNIGPKPNGEIQIEQEERLREVALWNYINGECIHNVRPWKVTHEGPVWFTASKDGKTVYAIVTDKWKFAQRREFIFRSIEGGPDTKVSVLGHGGEIVEYRKGFVEMGIDPKPSCQMTKYGLAVSALRGQRLYSDYNWSNPVVLKIENVKFREAYTK